MALKQQISQIQTQRLVLSPQIRQFLRLLQMPVIEMQETIKEELAANPAIEEVQQDDTDTDERSADAETQTTAADDRDLTPEEIDFQKKLDYLEKLDEAYRDHITVRTGPAVESIEELEKKYAYRESLITKQTSLAEHLTWQSQLLHLTEKEEQIIHYIIGNINPDGYLTITLEEIANANQTTAAEAERLLKLIQQFDPPGVAARNLEESLDIQLARMGDDTKLTRQIIAQCLALLKKRKYEQIARALQTSKLKVQEAVKLISRLEPKPGRPFYQRDAISITPDIRAIKDDVTGQYQTELVDETFPRLRINAQYRRMLRDKSLDRKTREYLRDRIHSGLWFMNALEQRRTTLQRIADAIVKFQHEYLENGLVYLKPLRMKDIAQQIGIHESTVSRAIQAKYMSTPHGTVAMKSFFSNSLATEDGGVESQTSIVERVKSLIEKENPAKPLSDQKLCALLKTEGIKVARRTVAKYREMLKILPSHMRKREIAA